VHPKIYGGRVDLYFEVGNQRFVAESKHVWVAAKNREPQTDKIWACIKQASEEVRRSKPINRTRRLAIVFAVPYIPVKGKSPLTRWDLQDLKDGALWSVKQAQETDYDAMAWTFPRLGRYGEYTGGFYRSIYPGVIMLLKVVR
jgi:hypothetical protein